MNAVPTGSTSTSSLTCPDATLLITAWIRMSPLADASPTASGVGEPETYWLSDETRRSVISITWSSRPATRCN